MEERPVEKIIELAASGECANFQPAMSFVGMGCRLKIFGRTAHSRQEGHGGIKPILQILEELGLVAFHGPDIIAACLADLDGYLSLGVQGISDHHFIAQIRPADIDRYWFPDRSSLAGSSHPSTRPPDILLLRNGDGVLEPVLQILVHQ